MSVSDQAAGLRQWAGTQQARSPRHEKDVGAARACQTLVVVGLPGVSPSQTQRVLALLDHWAAQGRRWVGSSAQWRIAPVEIAHPQLPMLIRQQSRWALWVGNDPDAFRRAFRQLSQLKERNGPRRLLAVHSPDIPREGLLDNLQQAAWSCLGIELLVMVK